MVVRISGEVQVRQRSAKMKHRGELDAEFARRVNSRRELERLEHRAGLIGLPQTAPEGRVEQYDVDERMAHALRELLEVDDNRVCRGWNADCLAHSAHPLEAPGRIFEIIVVEILDSPGDADGFLNGPGGVWIEAQPIA